MNVTKIIFTRCQIFHLKCTKFDFGFTGEAHIAPTDPLAGFEEGKRKGRGKRKET